MQNLDSVCGNLLFTSTSIQCFNELTLKGSVRSPGWLSAGRIRDDGALIYFILLVLGF